MPAAGEPRPVAGGERAPLVDDSLLERLYALARGERWQLNKGTFQEALRRSLAQRFGGKNPSGADIGAYVQSLHLEDLALACACAAGNEAAWDYFVREFRPVLYAAARAVAGDSARELADSLYAELYGVTTGATIEKRKSLFEYFHGRSKLSTWLRAVLAQRHVDTLRAGRRLESLDDAGQESLPGRGSVADRLASSAPPPDPERPRYVALLQETLVNVLAALEPRDRLRLSYYYVQDLTLAQIGRLLGEHEATASRKLERTRGEVRKQVESTLRDAHRLSDTQVKLCFQYAVEEWHFDLFALNPPQAGEGSGALAPPQTEDPGARKR